jgi:hypothetical protein
MNVEHETYEYTGNNRSQTTKGLKKNLEAIPGKHSIDSLQVAAILGTSHVARNLVA